MTNNVHCERFESILNTIYTSGIKNSAELKEPKNRHLYTELWFALQNFISYFALCSKTHKNSKGEITAGNIAKIRSLIGDGVEHDEICTDIQLHIIKKLDLVLSKPLEHQKNYCYRICNNCVNDMLQQQSTLKKQNISFVSLDEKVTSDEHSCTYENFIPDVSNSPEDICVTLESAEKRASIIREINARRLEKKRETLLYEISALAEVPDQLLCRLLTIHMNIKPRNIPGLIKQLGKPENLLAAVLLKVSKTFCIDISVLRSCFTGVTLPDTSLKADTNDSAKISAEVSRLTYKAKIRLEMLELSGGRQL